MTLNAADVAILDKKVKATKSFADVYEGTVLNYRKKEGDSYPAYKLAEIKKTAPTGFRYVIKPCDNLDIIWHRVGEANGALFGVYQGQISLLSGLFMIEGPFVFLLNDNVYVFSSKSCQWAVANQPMKFINSPSKDSL